jgi:orotidine-5'-phosphate decarboxylase
MSTKQPFLFIALDGLARNEEETLAIAEKLSEVEGNFGFKFNLDYILLKGLQGATEKLSRFNRPLFADTKTWNGSRTMAGIVGMAVDLGLDYINVWAQADREIEKAAEIAASSKTTLLGLTVLSHYDNKYCEEYFDMFLEDTVRMLFDSAEENGCKGVILPGTCLKAVSNRQSLLKVATGIRPTWYQDSRHEQETEPREAIEAGADIIICGSPIMKSADPALALQQILEEML